LPDENKKLIYIPSIQSEEATALTTQKIKTSFTTNTAYHVNIFGIGGKLDILFGFKSKIPSFKPRGMVIILTGRVH